MLRPILLATIALAAARAQAAPLVFGAINGSEDLSHRVDVGRCASTAEGYDCALARTSFGGLSLAKGRMMLDARGRVRAIRLFLDREDHERAQALLTGRYGKPTEIGPEPRWTRFDEDARISLKPNRPYTVVAFDYPRNDAVAGDLRGTTVWTLLAFICGGLAVGAGLKRVRRRALAPLSMKQTLERRLREGGDLSF